MPGLKKNGDQKKSDGEDRGEGGLHSKYRNGRRRTSEKLETIVCGGRLLNAALSFYWARFSLQVKQKN